MSHRVRLLTSAALSVLLAVACGSGSSGTTDAGTEVRGNDGEFTGRDATGEETRDDEGLLDAPRETGRDAAEGGLDAEPESGQDTGLDVAEETTPREGGSPGR